LIAPTTSSTFHRSVSGRIHRVGGNVIGRDINGLWGGNADKVAICPSVANNNHFKS
jgi:hypothetical protein